MKICEIRLATLIFMGNSPRLSCSCRWPLWKERPHWLCDTAYHLYFMLSEHSLQVKFCPRYFVFASVVPHSIYLMVHLQLWPFLWWKNPKLRSIPLFWCIPLLLHWKFYIGGLLHTICQTNNVWATHRTMWKEEKVPGRIYFICFSRNALARSWGGIAPELRTR